MEGALDLAIQAATTGWNAEPAPERKEQDEDDYDEDYNEDEEEWSDDEMDDSGSSRNPFGDLTDAKLNVLKRQGRTGEYLTLCQGTGRHLPYALMLCELQRVPEAIAHAKKQLDSVGDVRQLAERLREMGHLDDAISMGEHGLNLRGSKASLAEWLAPIEEAQGRTGPALQAWQAAFSERPTLATYQTLKRLAGPKWTRLQPQLMAALKKSGDSMALAEVLLSEEEWDQAIKVAERRDAWYPEIEMVADAVLPYRPEWVAHTSIKQAERLMVKPESKNYPHAANWLKKAKKAYAQTGQTAKWQAYLQKLKEQYSRRPSLQAELKRL